MGCDRPHTKTILTFWRMLLTKGRLRAKPPFSYLRGFRQKGFSNLAMILILEIAAGVLLGLLVYRGLVGFSKASEVSIPALFSTDSV